MALFSSADDTASSSSPGQPTFFRWVDTVSMMPPSGLRACADRSWPTRRSAFPTVAAPGFPAQSPHYDHHVGEGNPEVDHPPHPLRTPHQLLVGVVPRTRTLHHPPIRGPMRRRLAFLGDLPR